MGRWIGQTASDHCYLIYSFGIRNNNPKSNRSNENSKSRRIFGWECRNDAAGRWKRPEHIISFPPNSLRKSVCSYFFVKNGGIRLSECVIVHPRLSRCVADYCDAQLPCYSPNITDTSIWNELMSRLLPTTWSLLPVLNRGSFSSFSDR